MDRIALLFPGQGCQHRGMGKNLYDEFEVAKKTYEEANDILKYDLSGICFNGSILDLNKIENMFLAILTTSVAIFRVYMQEIGILPYIVAGHSLGEYSALTCSGALSFADALMIVRQRGMFAQEVIDSGNGAMTIIDGIETNIVEKVCSSVSSYEKAVNVGCYNSPVQTVISGNEEAVKKAEDILIECGANITPLLMSAPFHSSMMCGAADKLRQTLHGYKFNEFKFKILSNTSALPYQGQDAIVENLTLQMHKPVYWSKALDYIFNEGVTCFIEIGPQALLTGLLKSKNKKVLTYSFGQKDDRLELIERIRSKGISKPNVNNWESSDAYGMFLKRCLMTAICTQNLNKDDSEYDNGVIKPYEMIQSLLNQLESKNMTFGEHEIKLATEAIQLILNTKKVPAHMQEKLLNRIFEGIDIKINTCV